MATLLVACADGTGPTGEALTQAEALAVADGVARAGESGTMGGVSQGSASAEGQAAATTAAPPRTVTVEHRSSHPCPISGSIAIEADATLAFDAQARSFEYDASGLLAHAACAFDKDGVTLTVDGNPNLEYAAHAAAVDGKPSGPWTSEVKGSFRYTASDGREGVCTIDLTAVTDFTAKSRVVQGDVCGHTIDRTLRWSD